ncbi:MAG: GLPGLI family protein [Flavobacterium sp.]
MFVVFLRKVTIIVVFAIGQFVFSQNKVSKNSDLRVTYGLDFKKLISSESSVSENMILIVNDKGSLFTFETMMNLNEVQKVRGVKDDEVLLYRSSYYYLIKNDGKEISHFEAIGSDTFNFSEKINSVWQLINQDTLISGYACKKAVIKQAGREWRAWYSTDIPVSFGPYKFYGLPGLIMNIKDSENIFNFTVNEIIIGNFDTPTKVNNFFINEEDRPFESIKSTDFYALRKRFYQMSLNEKLNYMNRENGAKQSFVVTNASGEAPRLNSKPTDRNFIEQYNEK